MKIDNIKLNFIFNLIRLSFGTIFFILITPYITRKLGSQKLGEVEYINSIISYFILFTSLGIPYYGVREIAKVRESLEERSRVVIELSYILLITTIIGYICLFIIINSTKLREDYYLIIIIGTNIFFNNIGVEWFYKGIENQRYITKRYLFIRVICLILIFILVKKPNDYLKYAFIVVLMNSGSNIFNFFNMRKYIKYIKYKRLNIMRHFKPILTIFSANIALNINLNFDIIMLGLIDKSLVAIYFVPNRLIRIILVVITAFGHIILPRIVSCFEKKEKEKYRKYLNYSLNYILMISFPSMIGVFILSKNIIYFLGGENFFSSIGILKILSIVLLLNGITYFLGYQLLYPLNLEKYYMGAIIVATIFNVIGNYVMIPKFGGVGAAIGTVISESIGLVILSYLSLKYTKQRLNDWKNKLKYFLSAMIMGGVIYLITRLKISNLEILMLSLLFGGIIYIGILIFLKEKILMESIQSFKNRRYLGEKWLK